MKVNILADYKENGIDKNEPHIIMGARSEFAACVALKSLLEAKGYDVQALVVVDGDYTIGELHDMANYGIGLDIVNCRPMYMADEMRKYIKKLEDDPEERRKAAEEIRQRVSSR